jgi:hypothetical protein
MSKPLIGDQLFHFNHRKPISKSYFNNASYKALFYAYLSYTEWKGITPIGEIKQYFKKLRNDLEKKLKNRKKSA